MKQVQLPIEHFRKSAKREYSNWKEALIREFFQNSVDANSKNIHFNVKDNIIEAIDDGIGMSLQDCEEKLLTIGGTDKVNQIGGFGVAKQILYFAWPYWEIRSQDYTIKGEGTSYDIFPSEYIQGVYAKIQLPDEDKIGISYFSSYLNLCNVYQNVYLNGELYSFNYDKGEEIRDIEWGKLYKTDIDNYYLNIRVNGMLMTRVYIGTTKQLTLELQGNTRDILTCNRDGLNDPYKDQLQALVREIVISPKSALTPRSKIVKIMFEGMGNTYVGNTQNLDQIRNRLSTFHLKAIGQLKNDVTTTQPSATDSDTPNVLLYSDEGEIPLKYYPKNWPKKIKKTMSLWQRIIRQVLTDNMVSCTFGIGITLQKETQASYLIENNIPFFLLNPETWHHEFTYSYNDYILKEMKQRAIHEITHFSGQDDHNEIFIIRSLLLEANTWQSEKEYKKLNKLKDIVFIK